MLENYVKHDNGLIQQVALFGDPVQYDYDYMHSRYDQYRERTEGMSCLRLGYVMQHVGDVPKSVLDVGYGNGSFLRACSALIPACYGNDVSNYPLPRKINFVEDVLSKFFEVVTFFDSLEHFTDLSFMNKLRCAYVVVSVPNCHYDSDEWFKEWKHRRPDEHLWHFNLNSLVSFMGAAGFLLLDHGNVEDAIRGNLNGQPNILTACFKSRHA